jgi:hypothetical protein
MYLTFYSAGLAFWPLKLILPNPNVDVRAAFHLGVAKPLRLGLGANIAMIYSPVS